MTVLHILYDFLLLLGFLLFGSLFCVGVYLFYKERKSG